MIRTDFVSILALASKGDGAQYTDTDGSLWTFRYTADGEEEWKCSPYGRKGDMDGGASCYTRDEIEELGNSEEETSGGDFVDEDDVYTDVQVDYDMDVDANVYGAGESYDDDDDDADDDDGDYTDDYEGDPAELEAYLVEEGANWLSACADRREGWYDAEGKYLGATVEDAYLALFC